LLYTHRHTHIHIHTLDASSGGEAELFYISRFDMYRLVDDETIALFRAKAESHPSPKQTKHALRYVMARKGGFSCLRCYVMARKGGFSCLRNSTQRGVLVSS
jgi:hypothetical protein